MKIVVDRNNTSISFGYYLWFLFIISDFLLPAFFTEAPGFGLFVYFINYLSLISLLLFCAYHIKFIFKYEFKLPVIFLGLYFVLLIYSSLINNGIFKETVISSVKIFMLCLCIGLSVTDEKMLNALLFAVRDYCFVCYIINLGIMLIYPSGIPLTTTYKDAPHFFFGNVNSTFKSILPGFCCAFLLNVKRKIGFSVPVFIYIAGSLITFIFVYNSVTSLVALLFISAWMAARKLINKNSKAGINVFLIVFGLVDFALIGTTSGIVTKILSSVFHKSVTLSGRTYIWDRTIGVIRNNLLFGKGIQSEESLYSLIRNNFSAHNYLLDVLFQSGILGSLMLFIFIIILYRKIISEKTLPETVYCAVGFVFCCFVIGITEPMTGYNYFFFSLIYAIISLYIKNDVINKKIRLKLSF